MTENEAMTRLIEIENSVYRRRAHRLNGDIRASRVVALVVQDEELCEALRLGWRNRDKATGEALRRGIKPAVGGISISQKETDDSPR